MKTSTRVVLLGVVLQSAVAAAGSDTRDCETTDKSVVMGAGNGTNRAQFKVVDANRKPATHDAPVMIMPQYSYNTDPAAADLIIAVPISTEKVVTKKHQTLHVTHKDGTSCDGRERWDDRSVQSYVLMGANGASLAGKLPGTSRRLTPDGYLVAEFRCHTYGVSSPGGCFVEPGDATIWK